MKITHFNNSFIMIDAQGERMVCDPWVGKANAGGWQSFPEFSLHALCEHLSNVKWVYLSHLHDDHFHPETLEACDLLDRDFIIKRFKSPVLRERLKRLGVKQIHEVDPFTVERFGPFEVSLFPQMTSNSSGLKDDVNYDLDTSIVIKAEGSVFFNQVDNPLSLEDLINIQDFIEKYLGSIDIACLMSGAASEYPHLFLGIDQAAEKQRIVERSLQDLGEWLRVLKPHYFFPAGGTYLIPGSMGVFNHNIAQPNFTEISRFIETTGLPVKAFPLEGGHFIALRAEHKPIQAGLALVPLEADRQEAIAAHHGDTYDHETLRAPDWPVLVNMLDLARDSWNRKISQDQLTIYQAIRFDIYQYLKLDQLQPDKSQFLGSYELSPEAKDGAGTLVIHIDHRALFGCLTRRLIWNGVLGAMCLYDRQPNKHYPTDFFSLNYFSLSKEQLQALTLEV